MAILEFTRRFSMAHRFLADASPKCVIPHGHNELVSVRLAPRSRLSFGVANMAAPFELLKGRWHAWIDDHVDHCFQLNEADPLLEHFRRQEPQRLARIMTFQGDPTTEALAACFWLKLAAFLEADEAPYSVDSVRVEETPTNAVLLTRDVFSPEKCGLPAGSWPRRPDWSINDLA